MRRSCSCTTCWTEPAARGPRAAGAPRLDAIEAELNARLRPGPGPDAAVRDAIARLDADPSLTIGLLASDAGLRHPAFVARFKRATGSTPKRYAELVRFHRLIDRTPLPGVAAWSEGDRHDEGGGCRVAATSAPFGRSAA